MNIHTEKLFNDINEVRSKLCIYQDKTGYNFSLNTDIKLYEEMYTYLITSGITSSNVPCSVEIQKYIQDNLSYIKSNYSQLF